MIEHERASGQKSPKVRVNGVALRGYRKPESDLYEYDIDWLLNDAPALLGESGVSYSGGAGGGGTVVDTGPFHDKAQAAMPAVQRARQLSELWRSIEAGDRAVLERRYLQRRRWPFGIEAFFGELGGVVIFLAKNLGEYGELRNAVSNASKHGRTIARFRRDAEDLTRQAHNAWRAAKRDRARRWAEATT